MGSMLRSLVSKKDLLKLFIWNFLDLHIDKLIPDWPQLLSLYSRLGSGNGKTVLEWMHECNVQEIGIDPRRFVVFGVTMVGNISY